MQLDQVEINANAITVEEPGDPYAFVGGMVDLAPERARLVTVGWNIEVLAHETVPIDASGDPFPPGYYLSEFNTLDGVARRTVRLVMQTVGARGPKLKDLIELASHYERGGDAPAGFTDALQEWITDNTSEGTGEFLAAFREWLNRAAEEET